MSAEGRKAREAARRVKLGLPKETKKESELREKFYSIEGQELHRLSEKELKTLEKDVAAASIEETSISDEDTEKIENLK